MFGLLLYIFWKVCWVFHSVFGFVFWSFFGVFVTHDRYSAKKDGFFIHPHRKLASDILRYSAVIKDFVAVVPLL